MFDEATAVAVPYTPRVSQRVRDLLAAMTLEEKLAQLVGFWVDHDGGMVAPRADQHVGGSPYEQAVRDGIGHLTRVYGTRPVEPAERAAWLRAEQRRLRAQTRLSIPAIVHEECLTGLAAWKATAYPTPLAWGASFDPELVQQMAAAIGGSMRELGIHQGLAPVLDVIGDPRWGRVDECIAEDPMLVGTIGAAYVAGLQSAGVDATLKHFVGYSMSQAGRNHAPVHAGPREVADVLLPPFEAGLAAGAASVMNSYAEIDGMPVAADERMLTDLLHGELGFDGVVVADYFSVEFLHSMHGVAADAGHAAELALTAGIDVELPTGDAYLEPLAERVRDGRTDVALVDRAVLRVLAQKERLGLLDETFDAEPPAEIDLDPPHQRRIAHELAAESLVLLTNDGTLPLAPQPGQRIAVIGPNAHRPEAHLGCYSFVNHVLPHHPGVPNGVEIPSVLEGLRDSLPGVQVDHVKGCTVEGDDRSGIPAAVELARAAAAAVLVVGDQAGLFGRGTVGEGNDVASLELPGVQRELVEAVVATGVPVVLVLLTGRPYAIAWAVDGARPPAAVLQAFFPGEEAGPAIADVLTGARNPSGRLPVTLPRSAGDQPYRYLHPFLAGPTDITSVDPTPVLPFGHGLSYTTFAHADLAVTATPTTDGGFVATVRVTNTGSRAGADVVQLYGRDAVASVTRPVAQLLGFRRIHLEPGQSQVVAIEVPATRLAFTGRDGRRVVEPGELRLWVGASCADRETEVAVELEGPVHVVR